MGSENKTSKVVLGVIPARGGSKGIVDKNIRKVAGNTLVGHAVRAGAESQSLTKCIVSTDSEEIAAAARDAGGLVPFLRPKDLAGDKAPTWQALSHAIGWYEDAYSERVDLVVTLQPTAPQRVASDVDAAMELMIRDGKAKSLISVCSAGGYHPLTLYYRNAENRLSPMLPNMNHTMRRQDFPDVLWRNGAIYVTRRDLIVNEQRVVCDNPLYYEMPSARSINIDEPVDLEIAHLLMGSEST